MTTRTGQLFKKVLTMNNGRTIPQVGLGTYTITDKAAIQSAFDVGYKHFDTAIFYKNDKWIGEEMNEHAFMNGFTREDYFVCSKVPPAFQDHKKATTSIINSVKSAQTGYLDCMQLLLPNNAWIKALKALKPDPLDPVQMTDRLAVWTALEDQIEAGTIKSASVSNCTREHLEILLKHAKVKPVYNQIETHPLCIDDATVKFCQENDIIVQAYAPFAKGNSKLTENGTLSAIAARNEIDVHQLILLWCLQKGFVVLPKSVDEDRQARNINLEGLELSADDVAEIDDLRSKDEAFKQY